MSEQSTDYGVIAHKIADEAVKRIVINKSLGTPSWYNIIRESAIDVLVQIDRSEADHD